MEFFAGSEDLGQGILKSASGDAATYTLTTLPKALKADSDQAITAAFTGSHEFSNSTGLLPGGESVAPRPLTLTPATNTKVYDSTTSAAAVPTITSGELVTGDTITGLSEAYTSAAAGSGRTLVVTGFTVNDGNHGQNYIVYSAFSRSGKITKAALTITATTNTKVYDATTNAAALPTVLGLKGNDTVTGAKEVYNNAQAGTNKIISVKEFTINDGNSGGNYTVTKVNSTTGVINKASLTITATHNSKTYNSNTHANARPTVSGLKGDDKVIELVEAYTDANAGEHKSLKVTHYSVNDGNGGNNYTVTTMNDTTGVIGKAPLSITATTNTKTYDKNTSAAALPTVSGLIGADTVTGKSEAYTNANAGSNRTLSVRGYTVNDGNGGNNYAVTLVNNTTGVIKPRALHRYRGKMDQNL